MIKSLLFILACFLSLGMVPENSFAVESSPISNRVLFFPNSDSYIRGPVTEFPSRNEDFTVEGYVYFPSYPPSFDFFLIRKEGLCEIKISKYSSVSTYYEIYFGVATGTPNQFEGPLIYLKYWSVGSSWHHISASYDSKTGEKRIYFDGVRVVGSYISKITYFTPLPTDVVVGGNSALSLPFEYFTDEVRVSRGVRYTSDFVPATSPFVSEPLTSALWHFDEPPGSGVFFDVSANNNNLTGFSVATTIDCIGFRVSGVSGNTSEEGGTVFFTVNLVSQPTANVVISVSSSDATEGIISPSSLIFTSSDWNISKTVNVTGIDDDVVDGDVVYSVLLGVASSDDVRYNGLDPKDVLVINIDNDAIIFGDINDSNAIDLSDLILAAQIISGITPLQTINKEADVNGDGKIGMEEVIYILQKVSELRQ